MKSSFRHCKGQALPELNIYGDIDAAMDVDNTAQRAASDWFDRLMNLMMINQ
jgi:hypothetical protein